MRRIRRGERGFTLIELLIVVAILGVLAAVVIPNVGRFFGRGEEEARRTEKHNVESAIVALMTENGLSEIPHAIVYTGAVGADEAVNTMTLFPDTTSDDTATGVGGKDYDPSGAVAYTYPGDKKGYLLYGHDITANASSAELVNYITLTKTKYFYTCEKDGTIRQWSCPDTSVPGNEFTY